VTNTVSIPGNVSQTVTKSPPQFDWWRRLVANVVSIPGKVGQTVKKSPPQFVFCFVHLHWYEK
jgi:hypothetical protein